MASSRMAGSPALALLGIAVLGSVAYAHDHHEGGESQIPEGETISLEPIDTTLWIHILIQTLAYGVIFPIGMVFGITKSRWHVPTQSLGSALALLGYFLGHAHKGREFVSNNVHSVFASVLQLLLIGQVVLGIYLKLHWENGIHGRIRRTVRPLHSVFGKAMPVLSWAQMVFGGFTALGFCQGDHMGQCLAHYIMGSSFIAYGMLLTILLFSGQLWLRRTGRSQEFFDSAAIAAWGCVNTFTEHRWGSAWVHNDWQHTTMGIFWWSAGLVGVWLSRDRDGNPKRNFVPGFILIITGFGMSAHPQELMVSAMTHTAFGYTLMATGLSRIVEIAFVLKDKQSLTRDGRSYNSFQIVPVFLMFACGTLFMGATEEQMALVHQSSMDVVSYIVILYSEAFLLFLFTNVLLHIYNRLAESQPNTKGFTHGHRPLTQHAADERIGDAEEFELEGLTSSDEGDEDRDIVREEVKTGRPAGPGRP